MPNRDRLVVISPSANNNLVLDILKTGRLSLSKGKTITKEDKGVYTAIAITRGTVIIETGKQEHRLEEGYVGIIFPYAETYIRSITDNTLITLISFTGYKIETYLKRSNITEANITIRDNDNSLTNLLTKTYEKSLVMPNRYCMMASYMYEFFYRLLDMNPCKTPSRNERKYQILCAIERMRMELPGILSIDELAAQFDMTRKQLETYTYKFTGYTPKKLYTLIRMEKSLRLLGDQNYRIFEIAEKTGYPDQFSFAKVFKATYGITPTEYRNDKSTIQENSEVDNVIKHLNELIWKVSAPYMRSNR